MLSYLSIRTLPHSPPTIIPLLFASGYPSPTSRLAIIVPARSSNALSPATSLLDKTTTHSNDHSHGTNNQHPRPNCRRHIQAHTYITQYTRQHVLGHVLVSPRRAPHIPSGAAFAAHGRRRSKMFSPVHLKPASHGGCRLPHGRALSGQLPPMYVAVIRHGLCTSRKISKS